jgi:hypothetical protein
MSTNSARMLPTTVDNRYSPFDDWYRWYAEDIRLGYDTCGLLARLAPPSSDEFDTDTDAEALRLLMHYNYSGKHITVTPEDYAPYLKPQLQSLV